MKKNIITISIFLSLISICWTQQLVEGIIAVVGKEIILKSEVEYYLQNYIVQNKINIYTQKSLLNELQKQIIEKLVEQKILLSKADEDTIVATDSEIEQRLKQHYNYLIQQAGSEEKLEQIFQKSSKKIKRYLEKEISNTIKIEKLRQRKFQKTMISPREVENFYNAFKDSLPDIEESVEIGHILLQVKPGEAGKQKAYEQIEKIREKIIAGADFAEMAKKYSQDPGSAQRGGDLSFIQRGDLVKEFEEVAFNLKPDEVSDIVETTFGYHIIKLLERRGEKIQVSHILIKVQPTSNDEEIIIERLKKIRQEILQGASFDSLALLYSDDQDVENNKGYLGFWEVEKLAIPEFKVQLTNLKPGEISEPFKTEYGYHILKLYSHQAKRSISLESDWEKIQQIALNYKIEQEYTKWITSLKEQIPIEFKIQL
jgi:peptidyl-prolyl cis-trans isomerase SurA